MNLLPLFLPVLYGTAPQWFFWTVIILFGAIAFGTWFLARYLFRSSAEDKNSSGETKR